jgi:hypothetical protein
MYLNRALIQVVLHDIAKPLGIENELYIGLGEGGYSTLKSAGP